MAQQIKITQTSNTDMNIGVPKNLTAVGWLENNLIGNPHFEEDFSHNRKIFEQAKQMETKTREEDLRKGYDCGYLDAQCNHINDVDGFIEEQKYLNK